MIYTNNYCETICATDIDTRFKNLDAALLVHFRLAIIASLPFALRICLPHSRMDFTRLFSRQLRKGHQSIRVLPLESEEVQPNKILLLTTAVVAPLEDQFNIWLIETDMN